MAGLSQFGDTGNDIAQVYKLGAGITGNRNIFGGKELTDEERFNLITNAVAPYLGRAIGNLSKEGLSAFKEEAQRFISDLGTGLNLIVKSPIYAYNYVANTYESNSRYKSYLAGKIDINNLTAKELTDLMKRIETDNDKLNDSKLNELSGELAQRFTNKEIGDRILQLERLNNLTGLTDAQKQLLEALKQEKSIRAGRYLAELENVLSPLISNPLVAGQGVGEQKVEWSKINEVDWNKVMNIWGNLKDMGYTVNTLLPSVGQETTTYGDNERLYQSMLEEQRMMNAFKLMYENEPEIRKFVGETIGEEAFMQGYYKPVMKLVATSTAKYGLRSAVPVLGEVLGVVEGIFRIRNAVEVFKIINFAINKYDYYYNLANSEANTQKSEEQK